MDGLLKKASAGGNVESLVKEAICSSSVYTFGELLEVPAIQTAPAPWLAVLETFAYGTWKDYQAKGLPPLDAVAAKKLKHLTLVSLSARHGQQLGYELLKRELDIDNLRELEDLVLDAIYQGLIEGKIDQQSQKVFVDFAIGRDVRDADLLRVQEVLANWVARSSSLVKLMEEKITLARSEIKVAQVEREEFDKRVKEVKENLRAIMEAQEADQRMQGKRVGNVNINPGAAAVAAAGQRRDPRNPGLHHGFFK